jgi:UDP-N-acetylmuramoyl-tripeptide--D-alanyl-D-alanine ligase
VIGLTLAEVAEATGGRLAGGADPAAAVTGTVEFDSRKVTDGGLFVAISGERADGHDFAAKAVAAGAVAVLAARDVGVPSVLVADQLDAMAKLASAVLARLPALTVIGITASSGKTSTKDLIAGVLSALGPTVAPPGSFNNELGHPYTVLRADEATRYLVLEKSARGRGHIAALTRIARPRIGVVLNVGVAHLGEFGSVDVIAASKGELVEALPPADQGGVAVLNADDHRVRAMADRTDARVVLVGRSADAEVRATDVRMDDRGRAAYRLVAPAGAVDVQLGLHGEHHVGNSLACAAVALELGMGLDELAGALAAARPVSRWRMEVTDTPGGVTVVNDAYNANPDSMRAALSALAAMSRGRRTWAVFGPMAELGPQAADEHEALGRLAVRSGVDRLVAVGELARPVHDGALEESAREGMAVHVPDIDAAVALLTAELRPGDIVLIKASRAAGLERVADALLGAEVPA